MSAIAPEDVDASPSAARPPVAYASICHHKLFTLGMFYLKVRAATHRRSAMAVIIHAIICSALEEIAITAESFLALL
jgi:hypothetical protein